jgi:plastocyanin
MRALAVLLALAAWAVAPATAADAGYWQPVAASSVERLEWISVDGTSLAAGSGAHVELGTLGAAPRWESSFELSLDESVVDGALVRHRLYLAGDGGGLWSVGTAADALPVPLTGGGPLRLTQAGDHLVVAQSGFGLRVLELPGHHAAAGSLPAEVARLPLDRDFTAVAGFGARVVAATERGELVEIALDGAEPRIVQTLHLALPADSLALQGTRVAFSTDDGISIVRLDGAGAVERVSETPARGLHLAGRRLVALAGDGIEQWRDASPAAALIPVTVSNNFFSPSALDISAGDTVRWSLSFGFHNVFSCIVGQSGCSVAANETFTNGPPADGPWVYSYTFTEAGRNPYVCQSHAPAMTGMVEVAGVVQPPPEVPDGVIGTGVTVAKNDPSGTELQLQWDGVTCPGATEYAILWGTAASLPALPGGTYQLQGSVCDLPGATHTWNPSPDASLAPGGLIWWVVVAGDDNGTEGSWGTDGNGSERSGPGAGGASEQCGSFTKSLDAGCR